MQIRTVHIGVVMLLIGGASKFGSLELDEFVLSYIKLLLLFSIVITKIS
jgi:hypothetical protein